MKSHQYIHESIAVDLAERIANGEFVGKDRWKNSSSESLRGFYGNPQGDRLVVVGLLGVLEKVDSFINK
ncbi:hypothetical protein SOV_44840 [Sporomusa ovata DSM 2662]|uniref:Uncharacterized protein n=1 Tax=Sporomusa ovata TaxID=2378 RepID=A0A0U1KU64_9FIRM|nr:hypothetical protein [Sporomusa ovata]EQB26872.1 hypothetical protein SOV_3c07460 [Sporomusa ovata DSM 2662]CQR70972.1 hypothetical protein SpAn4DRAFT_1950 [Sporomusa ovata]